MKAVIKSIQKQKPSRTLKKSPKNMFAPGDFKVKYTRYNFMTPKALKLSIYSYLYGKKRVRPSQLVKKYMLSRTRIHQVLKELLTEGKVIKSGKMPKIYYRVVRK